MSTLESQEFLSLLQTEGRVHSVETMGLLDGPGVRTVFFLQGCPLRCAYCHNPDSQSFQAGLNMRVQDLLEKARRYRSYHGSEGGITFSGGEALMQGAFLSACVKVLKKEGFHLALDTSGFGDRRYYEQIFPYIDTLLLDIKALTEEKALDLTGGSLHRLQTFMEELPSYGFKGQIWLRHVMLPGYTDDEASMDRLIDLAKPLYPYIERIEILPYHVMGKEKYEELGMPYRLEGLPPMDKKRACQLQQYVNRQYSQKLHAIRQERMQSQMAEKTWTHRQPLSAKSCEQKNIHLTALPLMKDFDADTQAEILKQLRLYALPKGEFVFRTGDPADSMYIIVQGHVKIYQSTADGKEQIYYLYHEGDFVGGLNVLMHTAYLYMGQATDDCVIAVLSKNVFEQYMLNNPKILRRILEKSFDRIRWAEDLVQRLATSNATMKVAALLLRLKDAYGQELPEGIRLELSINREEMGSYAGLTRETITRKLGEFKELGYIDFEGNKVIWIYNLEALENCCF